MAHPASEKISISALIVVGFLATQATAIKAQTLPSIPSNLPWPDVPTQSLPTLVPETSPSLREYRFENPAPPLIPTRPSAFGLYRVEVFGDNGSLLSRVQSVEPDAFIRQGEGVIQAGVFSEQINAENFARNLESQGIRTRIINLSGGSEITTSNRLVARNDQRNGYFVAIPGNSENLSNIAAQVLETGIAETAVTRQEAPRGPHVAVGPFAERADANRWNTYFRSLGMDARVYFAR